MYLVFEDEHGFPQQHELTDKPVVIGRSRGADIQFYETKLSREHCGIRFNGESYEIKDLGSKNGTYVNDLKIEESVRLKVGDKIHIGPITLELVETLSISTDTALNDIEQRMGDGDGYGTIMRQIIKDVDSKHIEKKD